MAKRQTMIPQEALPPTRARFLTSERAKVIFHGGGYEAIGIDHFAKPTDGLANAANTGRLRRNFQGYTDDRAPTLIGLSASSISKFSGGYARTDPKTGGYYERIDNEGPPRIGVMCSQGMMRFGPVQLKCCCATFRLI